MSDYASITSLAPDLGCRLPAGLPFELLGRVLDRVRAEAGGQPMVALINAIGSSDRKGRDHAVNEVGQDLSLMKEDPLGREQLIQRIEAWLRDEGPENEMWVSLSAHPEVAAKSGNLPLKVSKAHILPAGNQIENSVLHGTESEGGDVRRQEGKQGKTHDRYDLAAAVLAESKLGRKIFQAILDLSEAYKGLDEIEQSAAQTLLSYGIPVERPEGREEA